MGLRDLWRIIKVYGLVQKAIKHPEHLESPSYWRDTFTALLAIHEVQVMLTMLQGYKTYVCAALMGALTVLKALGYIDDATYQTLMALLGAGAVGTVAAKINRIANER